MYKRQVQAVGFLLHVVKLGIAEAAHIRIVEQNIRQAAVTGNEFLLGLRALAVAPGLRNVAVRVPLDAAVLADKHRQALGIVLASLVRLLVIERAAGAERLIMRREFLRILLVICLLYTSSQSKKARLLTLISLPLRTAGNPGVCTSCLLYPSRCV